MANKTDTTELEEILFQSWKDHITEEITSYCVDKGMNFTEGAAALGFPRGTVQHWRQQLAVPSWEFYFRLKLRLDGQDADEDRIKTNCISLSQYFSESLREYCEVEGVYKKRFVQDLGYNESAAYRWTNEEGAIPRAKDFFKVMGAIFTGRATAREILEPLFDYEQMEECSYINLIENAITNHNKGDQATDHPIREDTAEITPDYAGSPEQMELDIENAEAILLGAHDARLDAYDPASVDTNTRSMMIVLERMSDFVHYFRSASPSARNKLRELCNERRFELGMMATETRQLLREERNYQEYLEMNQLKPKGKK